MRTLQLENPVLAEVTPPAVELDGLVALFYPEMGNLGEFERCAAEDCPDAYRSLLAHEAHMTVTVEGRHQCSVNVEVLQNRTTDTHYLREILLRRSSDGRVVQYGIVRLALSALQPVVRDEIMAQKTPLGRVLIQHGVLRRVQLNAVWQVTFGRELVKHFSDTASHQSYGRTALIYCDGEPAVELLEIVAPEDSF